MPKPSQTSTSNDSLRVKLPGAASGQTIGLLGGSFNPAHSGHLNISLEAIKRLNLHQVWWIVSPGNPLKSHGGLAPIDERVLFARKLAQNRRIIVTDFERKLPTPYTSSTIEFLKSRLGPTNFVWMMGADNLAQIHLWKHWEQIFKMVPVAVIDRPGFRLKARSSLAAKKFEHAYIDPSDAHELALLRTPAWTYLSVPLNEISSTALRDG